MSEHDHIELIHRLAERDKRYSADAFLFVSEAASKTGKWLREGKIKPNDVGSDRGAGDTFHVSGRELLEGIRILARERWGLMAKSVFATWGVRRTEDFGEIVFLMVEDEDMGWKKRDCDTREDFAGGYSFDEAFDGWK